MNRVRVTARWLHIAVLVVPLVVTGCATPELSFTADDPSGERLMRIVDSPEAHALLVDLLAAPPPRYVAPSAVQTRVTSGVLARPEPRPAASASLPSQAELHAIGSEVSMDFAALMFAQRLRADPTSRPVQTVFENASGENLQDLEESLRRPGGFPYTTLFAPGWLYESHPKSGADFAIQRREFDRLTLPNRLIPTRQSGSVETNAVIIATAIREAARSQETVVIVSASKAGADVAYALTKLLAPEELTHVAAWVNAGGALRGTPLADMGLRAPISWIVRAYFRIAGWNLDGVNSMRTVPSSTRFEGARLPESITVVNLVAVPVSGTVGRMVRGGYWVMRRQGPTDGVVPLADSLWPGGINIVALGSDHLLFDFRDSGKGMALLRAVDFAIRRNAIRQPTAQTH